MSRTTPDDGRLDLSELLFRSDLSAEQGRRVYNSLVNGMIEGWAPDPESVSLRYQSLQTAKLTLTNTKDE